MILWNVWWTEVSPPQAAYTCYISGYQHRFTYFLRTIPGIEKHLQPVEEIIKHRLIPAITGGHLVNENERMLMSLPPKFGGLGIRIITEIAQQEYRNSKKMTNKLRNKILGEVFGEEVNEETKIKCKIRSDRMQTYKDQLEEIRSKMTETDKRRNEANQESGSYNWLTTLSLKEWGYDLNKEQFWDALRIRYNWELPKLPSHCACGNKFNLTHALSCKKGGFVSLRHNEIRDITALLLDEVCTDVRKEPMLLELNGETLHERSANTKKEARLDVSARGFWVTGQRVFCDVRVFDLNALRYKNLELKRCYSKNEDEKKKNYNERVLQVENGTFTPLVFSTHGGMGRECKKFYQRLTEMIAEKRDIPNSVATKYVRTRMSFSLLRSTLVCVRGSRSLKKVFDLNEVDMSLVNCVSEIKAI